MPESDKKLYASTTRNKTQAFDLEALQLLVSSNARTAAETTASLNDLSKKLATLETNVGTTDKKVSKIMKKIDINQAIQDDRQKSTTKSIVNLQTTIESQPATMSNDLRNDIDELRDKIRDGHFQHKQEVLRNNDLQTDLHKLKQVPDTTRATRSSSFPRFS
eukprot:scaffold10691_cov46-Attheya_sp.AAC.1